MREPEQLAAGQERVISGPDKAIAAQDMWIISGEMSIGSGDKSMWRQEMTSRPPASALRVSYASIWLVSELLVAVSMAAWPLASLLPPSRRSQAPSLRLVGQGYPLRDKG
jgi:hypothetical protein